MSSRFEFQEFYVADLDGLIDGRPNLNLYDQLASPNRSLIVDAGIASPHDAKRILDRGVDRIVAPSESVRSIDDLKRMIDQVGADPIVWSMDLKNGRPITPDARWRTLDAAQIVGMAADLGIRQFILLDLADVGENRGTSTLPLLRRLRSILPNGWFAVGGGVRSRSDLEMAVQAGADALLIASALHDGGYPFD